MSIPAQEPANLWHYTTGMKIPLILESGAILPIPTNGAPTSELPVIWLSRHPIFEPTAAKGCVDSHTGLFRRLTMQETHEMAGGLYRLKVSPDIQTHEMEWFRTNSGINRKTFKALAVIAKRQGANPDHWRVSAEPIPLVAIDRVEAWTGSAWEKSGVLA